MINLTDDYELLKAWPKGASRLKKTSRWALASSKEHVEVRYGRSENGDYRVHTALSVGLNVMDEKRLRAQDAKSKDVTPRENASRGRTGEKKSADSLPKILRLAGRGGSLQRQRVRCGKPNCRCARGELHEGYYYLFLSSPAGLSKFYVRRKDVPAVRAVIAERRRRRRAWRSELDEARAFLRRMMSNALGG